MEVVKIDGYSCNDNVVLTVCNYLCGEYSKVFWDSLRFRFCKRDKLGVGIYESSPDLVKNVEVIYGIEFETKSQIHAKKVLCYASEALKRMPCLLVEMDVFYCPWMTDYHIRHNRHTLIVLEVKGEKLVCIDTVLGKNQIMLSFEEMEQGFLRVIEPKRCKVAEKNKITYENRKRWDKKIEKALKRNINIRDMYLFYEELLSCSFETEFGTETNIWYVPLFTELSKVYSGHVRFAQFLREYFQTTKREDGLRVANEWENIGSHWHMLYLWVMKMHKEYIKSEGTFTNYKEQMMETLQEMIPKEEKLLDEIMQLLHKKKVGVEQHKVLQQYSIILPYNGKSHLCTFESDLYIPEDVFRIGRSIETSKCTFVIQGRDVDGNDVVNCSGETIWVQKKVKQICFLGCALWGNQAATFTIFNPLGRSKEKRVFVSDWLDKEYPEEETVWSTTFFPKKEGGYSYCAKVVQFSIYFDEAEYIEKMQLPLQEKVQLFAMTVLAED